MSAMLHLTVRCLGGHGLFICHMYLPHIMFRWITMVHVCCSCLLPRRSTLGVIAWRALVYGALCLLTWWTPPLCGVAAVWPHSLTVPSRCAPPISRFLGSARPTSLM